MPTPNRRCLKLGFTSPCQSPYREAKCRLPPRTSATPVDGSERTGRKKLDLLRSALPRFEHYVQSTGGDPE